MLSVLYNVIMDAEPPEADADGDGDAESRRAVRPHRWDLRVERDGSLTAFVLDADPPITVSGDSLASLHKQARVMMRPPIRASPSNHLRH